MWRIRPMTNIKKVVKVKHLSNKQWWEVDISFHWTIVPSVHLMLPSCGWSALFLHEKPQKTPWPDESNGRVSPLMSSWCIFTVLLLQWSKHVFFLRKWRRSSPQIAAVLLHHRNWFLNVTVESAVHMKQNELYRCFHLLYDGKKGRQILIKIHKQSDFKHWELKGILSVSAVRYSTTVMTEGGLLLKTYTSAPPPDSCKCFMVTGYICKYVTGA